jgi:hypothetical protein
MAGVTFTIAGNGQVVSQVISPGSADPVCVEGIAAGSYQIAQIVPSRLEMTTAANATLDVTEGNEYGVEFGSRLRPADGEAVANNPEPTVETAVPTIEPAPAEESGGMSVLAISGLVVMALAVIMLGVLIFLVLKKQ